MIPMKTKTFLALVVLSASNLCPAQTNEPGPADDWKPSSINQSGKQYPQVNSERRVPPASSRRRRRACNSTLAAKNIR